MDYNALTRAADMLHGLAIDMEKQGNEPVAGAPEDGPLMKMAKACGAVEDEERVIAPTPAAPEPIAPTPAAPEVDPDLPKEYAGSVFLNPDLNPAINPDAPKPAEVVTVQGGVKLAKDSTGAMVPWDERIHAGTKSTKADGGWKAKRNVDKALVAQVEAELRAAMAIPVPNAPADPVPVAGSATPTPATAPIVTPLTPTPAPAPVTPTPATPMTAPVASATPGSITTLPALMKAATGAGKTPEEMLAAAQIAGLASMALLGARPDLIPTVATALGLGV